MPDNQKSQATAGDVEIYTEVTGEIEVCPEQAIVMPTGGVPGGRDAVISAFCKLGVYHITGRGRDSHDDISTLPAWMMAGLARSATPFGYLGISTGQKMALYAGANGELADSVARQIGAALEMPVSRPVHLTEGILACRTRGWLHSDIRIGEDNRSAPPPELILDRLLDSLRGRIFYYLVFATPMPQEEMAARLYQQRRLAESLDLQVNQISGSHKDVLRDERFEGTRADLLSARYEAGIQAGMWRVSLVVGSPERHVTEQALSYLSGAFNACPDTRLCFGWRLNSDPAASDAAHENLLLNEELAAVCPLPLRDRYGFALRDIPEFDVDYQPSGRDITLGNICDRRHTTDNVVGIAVNRLTRHGLVCGHTGSGKSTTVRRMLSQLSGHDIPFLVLEPAKGEYRRSLGAIPNLNVFSVGDYPDKTEALLQFNPFAFPKGTPLYTHIGLLKHGFVSAFGLVPPAPYILEEAIAHIYEKRGWSKSTGTHPHGHDALAFPTMSDLLEAIDPIVDAKGYDNEITRNLKGALKTRIGSLCMGPRGLALDTHENTPNEILFDSPTIVEMHHMGSDDEKAFMMGLIILRLHEYRESRRSNDGDDSLRHLLVIEEAHRLLKNTQEKPSEDGNMAYQAIESFVNILAEIRACGQGVLVVEQIPVKLMPDVVKHTGLKIIHRMPPPDDRDIVGDGIVLSDNQKRSLALLETGEAVIHYEGMDGAVMVRVKNQPMPKNVNAIDWSGRLLSRMSAPQQARYRRVSARAQVAGWLSEPDIRQAADRWCLAVLTGSDRKAAESDLVAEIRRVISHGSIDARTEAAACRPFALESALQRIARWHGCTEKQWRQLCDSIDDPDKLGRCLRDLLTTKQPHHRWCRQCPRPCRFGYWGNLLGRDDVLRDDIGDACSRNDRERSGALRHSVSLAAERLLGGTDAIPDGLNYCVVGHAIMNARLAPRTIQSLLCSVISEGDGDKSVTGGHESGTA